MKPKKLSFNLNLVDLSVSGFWQCLDHNCERVTEPVENYAGVNCCKLCGSPRIKWNPPIFQPEKPAILFAEEARLKLDQAHDECQSALRAVVWSPSPENFTRLTRAIGQAHQALTDLSELENHLAQPKVASNQAA